MHRASRVASDLMLSVLASEILSSPGWAHLTRGVLRATWNLASKVAHSLVFLVAVDSDRVHGEDLLTLERWRRFTTIVFATVARNSSKTPSLGDQFGTEEG